MQRVKWWGLEIFHIRIPEKWFKMACNGGRVCGDGGVYRDVSPAWHLKIAKWERKKFCGRRPCTDYVLIGGFGSIVCGTRACGGAVKNCKNIHWKEQRDV